MRPKLLLMAAVGVFLFFVAPSIVFAEESYYKDKLMRIIVAATPGGGYDVFARLLARHMPKHIPGNPRMIVQNMPAAGGLAAAHYLYQVAKPDGLTIGHLRREVPMRQALEPENVEYDARRFGWIGSGTVSVRVIVSHRDSPIRSLNDLLDPKKPPLTVGSTFPPSSPELLPGVLNLIFERKVGRPPFKIIAGYKGTSDVRAAIERREIDGYGDWAWDSIKATAQEWLEPEPGKGFINLIGYVGGSRHPELEKLKVPFVPELITDPRDRAVINFLVAPMDMHRPFATTPATPPERLRILREAFLKTTSDKDFLNEASRLRVDVVPLSGEEVDKVVASILKTPPDVLRMFK